jgi:TPR repeat protein
MTGEFKWGAIPLGAASKAVLWTLTSTLLWCQTTQDMENVQRAANQGVAEAQYILGSMYAQGRGAPQDYAEAAHWYRKAANQGLAEAQSSLASLYDSGHGIPQDYAEAMRWYRKAADQGDAGGQVLLGGMYDQGHGVPQDHAEAAHWFRKAAEQGLAGAQYLLGFAYRYGRGVPQDYVQAHMWLNLAASRESGEEQKKTAAERDDLAAKMTNEQVAEAQRLAREWKPPTK